MQSEQSSEQFTSNLKSNLGVLKKQSFPLPTTRLPHMLICVCIMSIPVPGRRRHPRLRLSLKISTLVTMMSLIILIMTRRQSWFLLFLPLLLLLLILILLLLAEEKTCRNRIIRRKIRKIMPAAVQGEKLEIMHFDFLQLKFDLILQHYYSNNPRVYSLFVR